MLNPKNGPVTELATRFGTSPKRSVSRQGKASGASLTVQYYAVKLPKSPINSAVLADPKHHPSTCGSALVGDTALAGHTIYEAVRTFADRSFRRCPITIRPGKTVQNQVSAAIRSHSENGA